AELDKYCNLILPQNPRDRTFDETSDAESCLYLGQHCNALATKKCCPPFTCKFVNQREGICVREDPGV
ncbi:Egg protein, partial [Schistosoma japonicum]